MKNLLRLGLFSIVCLSFFTLFTMQVFGQNVAPGLLLASKDVRVVDRPSEKGILLYIRVKTGIKSVMLTESAELPDKTISTYALRVDDFNSYNGDEQRMLNGKFIRLREGYFILDSSAEVDTKFDRAFVLFIPYEAKYGYKNTRNGTISFLKKNNYINVRTFAKPYADYTGEYFDNSFIISRASEGGPIVSGGTAVPEETVVPEDDGKPLDTVFPSTAVVFPPQEISEPPKKVDAVPAQVERKPEDISFVDIGGVQKEKEPEVVAKRQIEQSDLEKLLAKQTPSRYSSDTTAAFEEIARRSNTSVIRSLGGEDILKQIAQLIESIPPNQSIDLVILLDTTRSMWDDITAIKSRLVATLRDVIQGRIVRIGLVYYKDREEEYELRRFEFTDRVLTLQAQVASIQATGGGDWAESVHEAIREAVENYVWISDRKIIVVVGDAPPHNPPYEDVDLDQIFGLARAKGIEVIPILVPSR